MQNFITKSTLLSYFAYGNGFVFQRNPDHFVAVTRQLLFVCQKSVVYGQPCNLLCLFKRQVEFVFSALRNPLPQLVVFAHFVVSFSGVANIVLVSGLFVNVLRLNVDVQNYLSEF